MTQRINSPQDLEKIRDRARGQIDLRSGGKSLRVTVHMGTCGIAAGARDVLMALMQGLSAEKGPNAAAVSIHQAGCAGLCEQEPMLTITDAAGATFRYGKLDRAKVSRIVQEHVLHGRCVKDLVISEQ